MQTTSSTKTASLRLGKVANSDANDSSGSLRSIGSLMPSTSPEGSVSALSAAPVSTSPTSITSTGTLLQSIAKFTGIVSSPSVTKESHGGSSDWIGTSKQSISSFSSLGTTMKAMTTVKTGTTTTATTKSSRSTSPTLKQHRMGLSAGIHQNEGAIHVRRDSCIPQDLSSMKSAMQELQAEADEYDELNELDEIERTHNTGFASTPEENNHNRNAGKYSEQATRSVRLCLKSSTGGIPKLAVVLNNDGGADEDEVGSCSNNTMTTGESSRNDFEMDYSGNHLICEFQPRRRRA